MEVARTIDGVQFGSNKVELGKRRRYYRSIQPLLPPNATFDIRSQKDIFKSL